MAQDDNTGDGGSHSSFPPDASEATVVSHAPSEVLEQMRAQYPVEPTAAGPSDVAALKHAGVTTPRAGVGPGSGSGPAALPPPPDVPTTPHVPDLTLGEDEEDVDPNGPTMLRTAPPNAHAYRAAVAAAAVAQRVAAAAAAGGAPGAPGAQGAASPGAPHPGHPASAPGMPAFSGTVPMNRDVQASMRAQVQGAMPGSAPQPQGPMGTPPQGMGWQSPAQHAYAPSHGSQSFQVAPPPTGQPRWILLVLVGGAAALVVFLVLGIIAFFLLNAPQPVRHV